jgi:uncharacterized protein
MVTERDGTARIRELLALDRSTIPADGGERFNRLIFEASPYLLQHAENPVDWYPWGDEAFTVARREDKPLLLSIGYATCHWCHVMAHESFEDPEVAAVINRHFISIKVDREERPDIDDQYMLVSQMMTGSGGWPLNIIMTPDREPFFAITYMPRIPRMGMAGITDTLDNIARLWRTRRDLVQKNCATVMAELTRQTAVTSVAAEDVVLFSTAWKQLERMYDPTWGGFGQAPKFPMPHYISFLLLMGFRRGETEPLRMAYHSLEMMRRGGICDQLGFGFHRYSVDRRWFAPHFEKMLYDQALLTGVCLDAFRVSGNREMLRSAEEILAGVIADLTSSRGGFFAALDADSGGEEGRYYLWQPEEIHEILGKEEGELFCRLFDVTPAGNFEGSNILHLERPLEEFVAAEGLSLDQLGDKLARWRPLLLAVRSRRITPLRDEKILTAWNGLMIASCADAYAVTGTVAYLSAALAAALFIETCLVTENGRLLRSWHAGREGAPAFLEDYAFFVEGLIALHQVTLQERFLLSALRLTKEMPRLFGDPVTGALFDTGSDVEPALVRMQGMSDGVIPSGNAVAALNLLRLGRITGDDELERQGKGVVTACSGSMARVPVNHLRMLAAVDLLEHEGIMVELTGERESVATAQMLRVIHRRYLPGLTLRFSPREGAVKTTVSLCAAGTCRPPLESPEELEELLADLLRAEPRVI